MGVAALGFLLLAQSETFAGNVPAQMNYQGQLVNAYGTNPPDGNYTLTFRIYDGPSAGNKLWGDYNTSVPLVGGRFNVTLGADSSSRLVSGALSGQNSAYLEIQVGNNSPITPRQQLLSAPYTMYAGNADTMAGFGWNALFTDTGSPTNGHIPGALIAPNTVTSLQLANGSVNTLQLANGAVTAVQLANGAVTATQIAPQSVGPNQLASGAALANLADGSVPANKIVPGTVDLSSLSSNVLSMLVPIGTVLPFYGSVTNLTSSWKYCDGTAVNDPQSPFNGQLVPDLRQQFLRGADQANGYPLGGTGGQDYAPDHTHYNSLSGSCYIPYTGGLNSWTGYTIATSANAFSSTIYELTVDNSVSLSSANAHGHTGTSYVSGNSWYAGGHDNRPQFISLHFIIRIK